MGIGILCRNGSFRLNCRGGGMKTIQKKFRLFGILLTFIVALGLIIQYAYLNNVITKDKELNMAKSIEHLGYQINSNLKYHSQYTTAASEFISAGRCLDNETIKYFKGLVENSNTIRSIYFGDVNNRLINSDDWNPPQGYDIKSRTWYIKAIKERKLVLSDIYIDALENTPIITISKPVYNKNGILLGVVASDISMEEIIKIVEDTKIKGLGYSFLIDGSGNILAHPKYKYESESEIINIDSMGNGIHEELKRNEAGKIEVELDGVLGYLSYQPVEKTDWIIGNFMSLEEFHGDNGDIWRMLFIALAMAIIIFSSFTYLQKVNFLIPVYKLDKDIENINIEENIGYRIPIEKNDPFTELRKSINLVLNKTHEFLEQIEQDTEEIIAQNHELEESYNELTKNIEKRKELEKKLINLSYRDQLTGLYNRRFFEEELRRLDVPRQLPLTLIMADVNGLKLINDSFGHKAGDELLKDIANILRKGCREEDIIARMSGDEFVIILPQTNEKEAEGIISRLKALSADEKFSNSRLSNMELSVSFGLGTKYTVETNVEEILKRAEDNMYAHKLFEGPSMRSKTIETIMKALYEKNKREEAHSKRVAMISQEIGTALGMREEKLKELENVGLLHDIGKIAINEAILDKPGILSDEEWEDMKKHPEIGYRILSTVNEMSQIADYTLYHHERYDGKGYPKGLKGEEIPLVSRIISIADAYDAMVSDRAYRKALSNEIIVKEFIKNAGTQFDPKLTRIFVEKILKANWEE